ncbi:hypothetical protein [Stigmatella aurantiaca]|uniref:Conserved uncharacterized protein n=1 Tax=Stigmatella aurantiaca (strain DW4/3-1) TaxID=378806 RepID=Q08PI8_STIAD|nr:hypothetical protein [Stigmatella aurantiaca]ADO76037.1 conserved uncharacterized protein [Stigmatella aurantiaca DW4/3-1]EAU62400.1 hypothetical protein STIAU_3122 [Stigmatella aurantiaca DW4/3-1]
MVPVLSSTGLVLHNLGLAAGFGGSLFGKIALNPAVKVISSTEERGQVTNLAWNGFNIVNAVSVGTAALTWLFGRSKLSGREIDATTRGLVIAKDVLLGATVALGAANIASGAYLATQAPDARVPVETGNTPTVDTPENAAKAMKAIDVMSIINLACMAGVIGVTALLNMRAGASSKWSLVSRFLP